MPDFQTDAVFSVDSVKSIRDEEYIIISTGNFTYILETKDENDNSIINYSDIVNASFSGTMYDENGDSIRIKNGTFTAIL